MGLGESRGQGSQCKSERIGAVAIGENQKPAKRTLAPICGTKQRNWESVAMLHTRRSIFPFAGCLPLHDKHIDEQTGWLLEVPLCCGEPDSSFTSSSVRSACTPSLYCAGRLIPTVTPLTLSTR